MTTYLEDVDCATLRLLPEAAGLQDTEITYLCDKTTIWPNDNIWWLGTNWKERPECVGSDCESMIWTVETLPNLTLEECLIECYSRWTSHTASGREDNCWAGEILQSIGGNHDDVCNLNIVWDPYGTALGDGIVGAQQRGDNQNTMLMYDNYYYLAFKLAEELPVTTTTSTTTQTTTTEEFTRPNQDTVDCDVLRSYSHSDDLSEEEIQYLCNDSTIWADNFLWWEGTNWKDRPECLGEDCAEEPVWSMANILWSKTIEECILLCYAMYAPEEYYGGRCWGAEYIMAKDYYVSSVDYCNVLVTWDPSSGIPLSDVVPQQRNEIEYIDITYNEGFVYHAIKLGKPENLPHPTMPSPTTTTTAEESTTTEESTTVEDDSSSNAEDSSTENNSTGIIIGVSAAAAAAAITVVSGGVYYGFFRGPKDNLTDEMAMRIDRARDDAVLWDGIEIEPLKDPESVFTNPMRPSPVKYANTGFSSA